MLEPTSSIEIEQRYGVDKNSGLLLPSNFLEYHQAEIGSGRTDEVAKRFVGQANKVLIGENFRDYVTNIQSLFSSIQSNKIKIRVRQIFDPEKSSLRAEFTLKEKLPSLTGKFKVYKEHNVNIAPEFAQDLIEHIAPRFDIPNQAPEYGVRKRRYIVAGPDGKYWDVDELGGLNTGPILAEIEVESEGTSIVLPPWATIQLNGNDDYKYLGTAELQKMPWLYLPPEKKLRYLQATNAFRYKESA